MANDKIYFRGDMANARNDLEIYWSHNDTEIDDVTRVVLDATMARTTALLYINGLLQGTTFDVVPAPTKAVAPLQPILSTTPTTVSRSLPIFRFVESDIGVDVIITDPGLKIDMPGTLKQTDTSRWSDKIEVLITAGSDKGSVWVGPSKFVAFVVNTARKFTQADIGRAVTYTRDDGAEILGTLISIRGTTKYPEVEIISLDGQYHWLPIESRVEFTTPSPKPQPKCSECNDTGVVDLFIGTSPCSICKP